MSGPWELLGWALTVCLALALAWLWTRLFVGALERFAAHRRSRDVPPQVDQIWDQNGDQIRVYSVGRDGRVYMEHRGSFGRSSWSDAPEEWKRRVRRRGLILVSGPGARP